MKRFFRLKAWRDFLTRGNSFFIAFGGIYKRSESAAAEIEQLLTPSLSHVPSGQAYVRLGARFARNDSRAVLIAGIGRLGNSIVQVVNGFLIAQQLSAKELLFHRFDAIGNNQLRLSKNVALMKLVMSPSRRSQSPRIIWRTYAMTEGGVLSNPCSEEVQGVREALRSGLAVANSLVSEMTGHNVLSIYLRSGDIFSGPSEPDYGQPPWAFYEKVLKFRPWARVELIAEDRGNPNHDLIVKWCTDSNVPLHLAGQDLGDAIRAVAHASNLVTARGTFVPAIVFLSEGPKEVFQFHDERNPLMCRENLTLWRVTDVQGEYASSLLAKNWQNSEEQRKLMVSYPESCLSEVLKDGE